MNNFLEKDLHKILLDVEKPARYSGGEFNAVVKAWDGVDLHIALCFPDIYEIGMSHLGLKILYDILNNRSDILAERSFMVWDDMERKMRENNIPLYTLENKMPLNSFDLIGFTLQYEMSYSSILSMLSLANIPLKREDRAVCRTLVCAGGPCAFNPEPLYDFIDFFVIGEAEEVIIEISDLLINAKKSDFSKAETLAALSEIEGIYVPSVTKKAVKKRIIKSLDTAPFPEKLVVPFIEAVHDRIVLEVMRGCIRGCRFCQAGYIYRPQRERDPKKLAEIAERSYKCTGYEEISLSSLSTSDYSGLKDLKSRLNAFTKENMINLSLPSLRIDNFIEEAAGSLSEIRKSGLTFAPEAGSQKMRDIINKNLTEQVILDTMEYAFAVGFSSVKLYFMIGLPFEEDEDVYAIAELAKKIEGLYFKMPPELRGKKKLQITVSVSSFVPKPHTPFQWCAQNSYEELTRKQEILMTTLKSRNIRLNWHDAKTSVLEGAFARGDKKLGQVLLSAHKLGCKLDGWNEFFDYEKWLQAFRECNLSISDYNEKERKTTEKLPWDKIKSGVTKEYLIKEYEKAKGGI